MPPVVRFQQKFVHKLMKMNVFFFLTICPEDHHVYDFDLSFLKMILKRTLYELLQGNVYLLFSMILK